MLASEIDSIVDHGKHVLCMLRNAQQDVYASVTHERQQQHEGAHVHDAYQKLSGLLKTLHDVLSDLVATNSVRHIDRVFGPDGDVHNCTIVHSVKTSTLDMFNYDDSVIDHALDAILQLFNIQHHRSRLFQRLEPHTLQLRSNLACDSDRDSDNEFNYENDDDEVD